MCDARNFLSAEDQNLVVLAIEQTERATQTEVVIAIATESGRYDRAEGIAGLATALLFLNLAPIIATVFRHEGDWNPPTLGLAYQSVAVVLGYLVGNILASSSCSFRRLFTLKSEMEEELQRGAQAVFHAHDLDSTSHRAGVLIYLSLFERRLLVLPDAALVEAVGPEVAQEICQTTREHLKKNRRREALIGALNTLQNCLAKRPLPQQPPLPDQLPNHLLLLHPRP
jgi:putative membrane protein